MKEFKVLVVDDFVAFGRMLKSTFQSLGCTVDVAIDGKEALEKIFQFKPNVIIMDIFMPGMNGLKTLRDIKKNKETSEIPVIIATGLPDTRLKETAFKFGATDFVIKPFQTFEIIQKVKDSSGDDYEWKNST